MAQIVIIEPFYGGSHKQLLDTILGECIEQQDIQLFTLPDKKWHWRARTSALYFSDAIPFEHCFKYYNSVLNLAELVGLRPDLVSCKKVLYFHENQLVYPVRKQQNRDFQYGYNQILSCLVADEVIFNSQFNMTSFLESISGFFKLQPDHRPKNLAARIKSKTRVLYFPVTAPKSLPVNRQIDDSTVLHIIWPHRWEHDKNPETFFRAIESLITHNCKFKLSVLGEQYEEIPAVFNEFKPKLETYSGCTLLDWGFVSKRRFYEVLSSAHVVVSTALHEFYGVSMIEATQLGCWPLCPARLSYPEIFPKECLYNTDNQLAKALRSLCCVPSRLSRNKPLDLGRFTWDSLKSQYVAIFSPYKHS